MRNLNEFNKRQLMLIAFATTILFFGTIIWWVSDTIKANKENLNAEFAGKIKHVDYDIKQFPTMTIGDSSYYIGSGYDTDHQIEVGDSLIKRKGSDIYQLIKYRTHRIIEFRK